MVVSQLGFVFLNKVERLDCVCVIGKSIVVSQFQIKAL